MAPAKPVQHDVPFAQWLPTEKEGVGMPWGWVPLGNEADSEALSNLAR